MLTFKTILAGIAAGATFAGVAIALSPESRADIGLDATTYIHWTGTNCIVADSAYTYAPHLSGPSVICGGSWRFTEGNIWPGDLFGADPVMGNASYIECAVFRGGALVYSDSAVAGDGTDVSCLRVAI